MWMKSALRYDIHINISPKKRPLAMVGGREGPVEEKLQLITLKPKKIVL